MLTFIKYDNHELNVNYLNEFKSNNIEILGNEM